MTKPSFLNITSLLVVLLASILYTLPNLFGDAPVVEVVLNSQTSPAIVDDINSKLHQATIQPQRTEALQNQHLRFYFGKIDEQLHAKDIIDQLLQTASPDSTTSLNLTPMTPAWLQHIGAQPMKLGLDLRGGIHLLLNVDINPLMDRQESIDIILIGRLLTQAHVPYVKMEKNSNVVTLHFESLDHLHLAEKALQLSEKNYQLTPSNQGTDYKLDLSLNRINESKMIDYTVNRTIDTLNQRINELGVSEAAIQRQGAQQISIDLPGIQDIARAKSLIGNTDTLSFYLVDVNNSSEQPYLVNQDDGTPVPLLKDSILTGDAITYASSDIRDGSAIVSIQIGGNQVSRFHQLTSQNIGVPLAVVRTDHSTKGEEQAKVISVATIRQPLGREFVISGSFSKTYADNLALLLRSGSLAAPISIVEETIIGPSLGQENIHSGFQSLIIGSALVIVFMAAYYRTFGLIANIALAFNVMIIIALLSILGSTLTLPGIAGIVLTVGMAVDANVLINERIREELRAGKNAATSVHLGYDKAWATIVDANATTLIVALILFSLGSGSIKGFAITLTLGLLASMYTSIFVTRLLVQQLLHLRQKCPSIGI